MIETRNLSLIIGQISISLLPPIHIDPQTIIIVVIALGYRSQMGHAVKAITLSPLRRKSLMLFALMFTTLLTPVAAVPTAQDTALLTKAACLLSSLWLSNRGKTDPEHDEGQLGPLDDSSILGSPTLSAGLHILHVNIRGGISTFAKWRSVIEILNVKNPDILVLTETGHVNSPSTLKWLTRNMHANELNDPDARSKLTDQFNDSLPYNIHSTIF
jgi:hypothetical protein